MTELLVDSSVLIDFFTDELAGETEMLLRSKQSCISIVSHFEVYKYMLKIGKTKEIYFVGDKLESFETLEMTPAICREAAKISHSAGLSTADSLIYATARVNNLHLVTRDNDLKGKPGVIFVKK